MPPQGRGAAVIVAALHEKLEEPDRVGDEDEPDDTGAFNPNVEALVGTRDQVSFKRVYVVDPSQRVPVRLLTQGYE